MITVLLVDNGTFLVGSSAEVISIHFFIDAYCQREIVEGYIGDIDAVIIFTGIAQMLSSYNFTQVKRNGGASVDDYICYLAAFAGISIGCDALQDVLEDFVCCLFL